MKRIITLSTIALILLASCHSTKKVSSKKANPTPEDIVQKMQTTYPAYTVAELKDGKRIYESNCKSCHELKNPNSLDKSGWEKIVPPMCAKVNENKKVLSKQDQTLILKYLVSITTIKSKS